MLGLHDSIRPNDPAVQRLLSAVEDAPSPAAFILVAWQVARVLTIPRVAAVLPARVRHPPRWPRGSQWGAGWRSPGLAKRPITSLWGLLPWRRRVGRCPHGGAPPQVAPWKETLGVPPPQRSSGACPSLDCALADCVPVAPAARLLGG